MNRVSVESVWDWLRTSRPSQWFTSTFPRGSAFGARRLSWSGPLGLRLTLGVAAAVLCWFVFFGIVQDLIAGDPLIRSDLRVVTFLQTMRSPRFTAVMVFFTYLGNWQIIVGAAAAFSALLYVRRRWWWLISFLLTVACGEIAVQVFKFGFGRARPDLQNALLSAAGASFPSGHTLGAIAVYGTVTLYFISRVDRLPMKLAIALIGIVIIALVGFSRIYLGVHWPSDVLASFALGAGWIFTAMVVTSIFLTRRSYPFSGVDLGRWWLEPALLLTWLAGSGLFYTTHPVRSPALADQSSTELREDPGLSIFDHVPRFTEDITRTRIEPINIIIIGSDSDLLRAFSEAEWQRAQPLGLRSSIALLIDESLNRPDPNAPGLPAFLASEPNDLTFERPTPLGSARERHHLHLWTTPMKVGQFNVWVGTVHLDTTERATELNLPFHQIDPAVDKERDGLVVDFQKTPCLRRSSVIAVTGPVIGQNSVHSPFFSDGNAQELWIDCSGGG